MITPSSSSRFTRRWQGVGDSPTRVGEVDDRQAALGLQGGDDASVDVVEVDHGIISKLDHL